MPFVPSSFLLLVIECPPFLFLSLPLKLAPAIPTNVFSSEFQAIALPILLPYLEGHKATRVSGRTHFCVRVNLTGLVQHPFIILASRRPRKAEQGP